MCLEQLKRNRPSRGCGYQGEASQATHNHREIRGEGALNEDRVEDMRKYQAGGRGYEVQPAKQKKRKA